VTLIEVRWHGRGGQGVVTVSRLLAQAALLEDKYAQAFPEFGPERLGAPILGFTRISEKPIEVHSQVYNPHYVVVLDPTLLGVIDVFKGLIEGGSAVVNINKSPEELKSELKMREDINVFTVDATNIAIDVLGRPIYNTAMLGALIRVSKLTSLESVKNATINRFGAELGKRNVAVIERAYKEVSGP